MEISFSVAVQIVLMAGAMALLASATFFFLARATTLKLAFRKSSSTITLGIMSLAFVGLLASYLYETKTTFYASLTCQADRQFAPAKITCINQSENFDEARWTVNDNPRTGSSELLEIGAPQSGAYHIDLTVVKDLLLFNIKAKAGQLVVVGEKKSFEREVGATYRISFPTTGEKIYQLSAPPGFVVDRSTVIVRLERHRGELSVAEKSITDTALIVRIVGVGRIGINGLSIKPEPAEGTLTIAFTARRA